MPNGPPRSRRLLGLWLTVGAGALVLLGGGALGAWILAPRWQPDWVLAHSPWVEPLLRAETARHSTDVPSWEFRSRICDLGEDAFPGLRRGLAHHDPHVRTAAVGGLQSLFENGDADPASREALRGLVLHDPDAAVRRLALATLLVGSAADESAVLVQAIVDTDAVTRATAAGAMELHPHAEHLPLLVHAAQDADGSVRTAAITGLGAHGEPLAVDMLAQALDDPLQGASFAAAIALFKRSDLAPARRRATLARLMTNLGDDGVRGNAQATLALLSLPAGPDVDAALGGLLGSPDRQTRQFAANLLQEHAVPSSPALVQASIEGLLSDGIPAASDGTYTPVRNANACLRWLVQDRTADDALRAALASSSDLQQRFCCALILALHRRSDLAEAIAPVLIPHLADNAIPRDGALAMSGLLLLGPAVVPWLERAAPRSDDQGRLLMARIRHLLDHPDTSPTQGDDVTVERLLALARDPGSIEANGQYLWLVDEDHWTE
jgi:HEAT repeat protein